MAKENRFSKINPNMTACGKTVSITVLELLLTKMETFMKESSRMDSITEWVKLTGLMELAMMVNFQKD